jgi:hypothetical protein
MGLDSYAIVTESTDEDLAHAQSFYYWRKHHCLDAWAKQLAQEKGVEIETVETYCAFSVQLEPRDIDRLEAEIESGRLYDGLPPNGHRRFTELCDRDFVSKARLAFAARLHVIYSSDW